MLGYNFLMFYFQSYRVEWYSQTTNYELQWVSLYALKIVSSLYP